MSDTLEDLRDQIDGAEALQSVVQTMKALAATSIGQYEQSVRALSGYYRSVLLGLGVCFRQGGAGIGEPPAGRETIDARAVVVFGSDQGLVGRFNEMVAEQAMAALADMPGDVRIWAVGERVHGRLVDAGFAVEPPFAVPGSVEGIVSLVGRVLLANEAIVARGQRAAFHLFYNRPASGETYTPASQRLLPLDESWQHSVANHHWPTQNLPEIVGSPEGTLRALLREYVFVSLFRACAESLASENASRLAAMQRADRNIEELLDDLQGRFHRQRQGSIDAELFDLIASFEALK
jgi:F-type H+-transporting ATPase subunit gamma